MKHSLYHCLSTRLASAAHKSQQMKSFLTILYGLGAFYIQDLQENYQNFAFLYFRSWLCKNAVEARLRGKDIIQGLISWIDKFNERR